MRINEQWGDILNIKKLLNTATVFALGVICSQGWSDAKDTFDGKNEYVVLTNGKYSVNALSSAGAKVTQTLEHQLGYVADISAQGAKDLKMRGFEVYENRVYTLDFVTEELPANIKDGQKDLHHPRRPPFGRRPRPRPFPRPRPPVARPEPCPECQPCEPCQIAPPEQGDPLEPAPVNPPENIAITDEAPWGTQRVQAVEAMNTVQARDIKVCVIDTGIDTDHPDLIGTFFGGRSFVPGNASFEDDQGHGTHVAGTVASVGNNGGITGVSQAQMYIVKALDRNGSGSSASIAEGILDCVSQRVQIISMSLGAPAFAGQDPLITRAINIALEADIHVLAAAGNDSSEVGWPAQTDGVLAISSMDRQNRLSGFSSRGRSIDYICPGTDVISARMGGGHVSFDGTSMATPHCAAILALTLSAGKQDMVTEDLGLPREHQGLGMPNALLSISQ